MRRPVLLSVVLVLCGALLSGIPAAAQIVELQGAWLIDGYTFQPGDRSPRGTIAYDPDGNSFSGTYVGLKLPADRPELHAWLYDTRTKKALHLGRLDYKPGTIGKDKGAFKLALPASVKDGNFKPYEVVAFSAEHSGATPAFPSGSTIQAAQRPAFYLYAPLPGSNIPSVYCGHGQDFSYTSDLEHTCFD
jgi:hypothetical protein